MQVVWRKFSGCHSKDTDPGSGDLKRYVHLQIEVDVDRWAKLPDRYFTRGGNGPACTYRVIVVHDRELPTRLVWNGGTARSSRRPRLQGRPQVARSTRQCKRGAHPGQRKRRRSKSPASVFDDKILHRPPKSKAKAGGQHGPNCLLTGVEQSLPNGSAPITRLNCFSAL